jgi:carbonic anhydrase
VTVPADTALRKLRDGNRKFRHTSSVTGRPGEGGQRFVDLSAGQRPFAAVLACSDSRVPVEAIFSQGPGQLFVVRVAGNVVGPIQVGSLEFAVEELGVRLILVLGHTHCGAVAASLADAADRKPWREAGNLDAITEQISAGLARKRDPQKSRGVLSHTEAVRLNTQAASEDLILQSRVLAARARVGELQVAGAVYDLGTGKVEFLL